jgi:hypothetical protein
MTYQRLLRKDVQCMNDLPEAAFYSYTNDLPEAADNGLPTGACLYMNDLPKDADNGLPTYRRLLIH